MSLILDALRRADAERQRAQAPGLQQVAQADAAVQASHGASGSPTRRVAMWVFAAASLLAAGAAGWWWIGGPRQPAVPAPAPVQPIAQVAAPAPVQAAVPVPMPAAPSQAAPAPIAAPVAAAPVPMPVPQPVPQASAAVPAPALPAAPERALPWTQLPESQRASISRLGLSGAVQSQDRTQSFLLAGGQIAREGDSLAPGIVLEHIGARSLRLRLDGRLVEVPL